MFPRPRVRAEFKKMILVQLHTDGTDEDSKKNSKFQESFTGTYSLPVYAIVSNEGKLLRKLKDLQKDENVFVGFLKGE